MANAKKRAQKNKETQQENADEDEQLPIPWKISLLLTFCAIVIIMLFQSENEADIQKATTKAQNKLDIPDPAAPLPPSMSKVYIFKNAAISSDSQMCSEIARNIMREKNGNVFDATISSLICNSLTNIQSMGVFGGFIFSAYSAEKKKSIIIDAQMTAPKNFPPSINLEDLKKGSLSIANFGGFLKGLWEIHKQYASIDFHELIEPSVRLCRKGVILSKHLRDAIETNEQILKDPYIKSIFIDPSTDKIKRAGSKIINTKQCDFLEILSSHHEPEIFSGKVGEAIEEDLREAGSVITLNDLKSYKLKIYEKDLIELNENYAMLLPETPAILIPSIVKILLKMNLNSTSIDKTTTIHRITEVFKFVFAQRSHLGDGDFIDDTKVKKYLLSSNFAEHVINSIDDEMVKTDIREYGIENTVPEDHGTSHISIVAQNGDAVSVTSSINFYFGAGMSGKSTGLIFNNGMDDFSHPKRSVNYFGLQETPTNYPEPGKRALSSMSPIIIVDRKTLMPHLVIGAAGGSKIISSLSLAIIRFLCCTEDIKEIIDAPRFHHQTIPNVFEYEYGLIEDVIEGLKAKNHETKRYRERGTIINALKKNYDSIHGISDYRKDSSGVAGY